MPFLVCILQTRLSPLFLFFFFLFHSSSWITFLSTCWPVFIIDHWLAMRNRPSILPRRKVGDGRITSTSLAVEAVERRGGKIWFKESSHRLEGVLIWELDGRHFFLFFPSLNISLSPSYLPFSSLSCRFWLSRRAVHAQRQTPFFLFLCVCVCSISLRRRNPFGKKKSKFFFLDRFFSFF